MNPGKVDRQINWDPVVLIVLQGGRRQRVKITFWHYFRVGLPVAALTLALGISGSRDSRAMTPM